MPKALGWVSALGFLEVTDSEKRVIIHLVRETVFIEGMLHHPPAIDVDLDQEGEPCLQLHMHEAKMFIKGIEIIIFAFAVHGIEGEQPIVMFLGWRVWQHSTTERTQMSPSSIGSSSRIFND